MIINRQYVTFRHLVNRGDPGGKIFLEKLHESYDEYMWEKVWEMLSDQCLYQCETEWGFSRLEDVIEAFTQLDTEVPFDNGCTYDDVTDVEIVLKDEISIILHLVCNRFDNRIIVRVINIPSENNLNL